MPNVFLIGLIVRKAYKLAFLNKLFICPKIVFPWVTREEDLSPELICLNLRIASHILVQAKRSKTVTESLIRF